MIDIDTKEIINSYMKALYELANEQSVTLADIKKDLNVFKETIEVISGSDPNVILCVSNKNFDSLIQALKDNNKISDLAYKFAQVLNSNYHFFIISNIIEAWDIFVLQQQGYKELELITSIPLTKDELEALKTSIAKDNKVYVTHKVRPSIIGGLIIKYDNFLFDDSVLWKLNNLENTMKGSI